MDHHGLQPDEEGPLALDLDGSLPDLGPAFAECRAGGITLVRFF
jgi:hypothetical protein